MSTLARLRSLVAVADTGSVREAARGRVRVAAVPSAGEHLLLEPADFQASRVFGTG